MAMAGYAHLLAAGRRLQWDADALDLSGDVVPPGALGARIRELVAAFVLAEVAVAEHLQPFVAAADGEAGACFALQAGDEARHARFFARVADEVLGGDLPAPAPELRRLFLEDLPAAAAQVAAGPDALADAVGLYHLVLEGIVFQAGQDTLLALLDEAGTLPGTREGVARVQGDERWHVGLGVTHLRRHGAVPDLGDLPARAAAVWGLRDEHVLRLHERRVGLASA